MSAASPHQDRHPGGGRERWRRPFWKLLIGGAMALALGGVALSGAAAGAGGPASPASQGRDRAGPINRGPEAVAATLVGQPAPAFPRLPWADGKALDPAAWAGKVVVIRNFTNGCPFCVTTLPALEQIHRDYRKRGVIVLGVYHPKPPRPVTAEEVRGHARALGVSFPVAIDADWSLVNSWWLSTPGAAWTSVTWVLDRAGRLRLVHPGGEYHPGGGPEHAQCRADEQQLRATLDRLLGS